MARIVRILVPTVLVLAWLGTVGPAAPTPAEPPRAVPVQASASAPADSADSGGPAGPERCTDACLAVHDPVTCTFTDGLVRTFGNGCEAERHACRTGTTIITCVRAER